MIRDGRVLDVEIKMGDFIKIEGQVGTYIVARTDVSKYTLISLDSGNRWCTPYPSMERFVNYLKESDYTYSIINKSYTIK